MSKVLTPKPGQFDEIISIIDNSRTRALKAVNAAYIAEANPGVKGVNRRGLYRIKQFYETYKNAKIVTPLVRYDRSLNRRVITWMRPEYPPFSMHFPHGGKS